MLNRDKKNVVKLNPNFSEPLYIYILPKLHKEGILGSINLLFFKFLLPISNPLFGNSTTNFKNSFEFLEKLKCLTINN